MEKKTQVELVKDYIIKRGSITTWEAFENLWILDLQSSIKKLRRKGIDIKDKWIYKVNRFGTPIRFKKYFLAKDEK